jgi:hypothetical protein
MDFQQILEQRSSYSNAVTVLDGLVDTEYLPKHWWSYQDARYVERWSWFTGQALKEPVGKTDDGTPVYAFPLEVGVRNYFRKHVSFLFGEVVDSSGPLVRTVVNPRKPFNGDISDKAKGNAAIIQQTHEEIWVQSRGRSIQQENALLSQFLGGSVYQVKWLPEKYKSFRIPITIHQVPPDWFYPVWSEDDEFDLLEVFVVHRINGAAAKHQYGIEPSGHMVHYVEHWTKDKYSIWIDNEPVRNSKGKVFLEQDNPFGVVPFVYIPHLREFGFYGASHLDDIMGLVKEYNARMSDQGLAIKKNIKRQKYLINVGKDPVKRRLPTGEVVTDLGVTVPGGQEPKVWIEDPPLFSDAYGTFTETLQRTIWQEMHLQELAFGENEGTQRSALALASQMWPSTAHARQERTHHTDGYLQLYSIINTFLSKKPDIQKKIYGSVIISDDFATLYEAYLDWMPQVPRDRESQLNEMVLRSQADLIAPENAMEQFGDVRNPDDEMKSIIEWKKQRGEVEAQQQEAQTRLNEPVAVPGTQEDQSS